MCVPGSVVSRWCGIIAEAAVCSHVSPLAVPELRSAPDALADEPSLFQCPLLSEVLHIGFGLDPGWRSWSRADSRQAAAAPRFRNPGPRNSGKITMPIFQHVEVGPAGNLVNFFSR